MNTYFVAAIVTFAAGASNLVSSPLPGVTLRNPSPSPDDGFGSIVAISGPRLVVLDEPGTVYVYDLSSPTPTIAAVTLNNMADSAAITGTRLVVGDGGADGGNGAAYIYDLSSAAPTVPALTLTNPSPSALFGSFGNAVAISGTRVVVADDDNADIGDAAYVYDLASGTPTVPVVTLDNPPGNDFFGHAVAISGTKVVVGAPSHGDGTGIAYVYDLASGTPATPAVTLINPGPDPFEHDEFGKSVAIDGMIVVIGSEEAERVRVYDLAGPTPSTPMLTFTNPAPTTRDQFGESVAISGTRIVVGARRDVIATNETGAVYIYDLASATPTLPVAILNNPTVADGDEFGHWVAVDGPNIVVGAPFDDIDGTDAGIAYVFGLGPALRINRAAPGFATISWTPALAGFVLQHNDGSLPGNWVSAPSGSANPVTIATTNQSRFYRLAESE